MPAPVKVGPDFIVSGANPNLDSGAAIAALINGGFVIGYSQPVEFNPSDVDTILVRHAGNGSTRATVGATGSATPAEAQVGLTELVDGRYVAVAVRNGDVALRLYELTNPSSSGVTEIRAVTVTSTPQSEYRPMASGLTSGQLAVVWFSGSDVLYRQYNVAGEPTTSETVLSSGSAHNPLYGADMATLSNGVVVVAWSGPSGAVFRIVNPAVPGATTEPTLVSAVIGVQGPGVSGAPGSGVFVPSVAPTTDGGFVIAAGMSVSSSFHEPLVNFYRPDGVLRASVIVPDQFLEFPIVRVAGLMDGRVMIVWAAANGTSDIWGQILSADGVLDGAAFQVNTDTTGAAYDPSIAVLADGRVVVSWTSTATGGGDVYAAVYDPREAGIFLTGTALGDDLQGSVFGDALFGGLGADFLSGGAGGDTLAGEAGEDSLFGDDGADFLYGGAGRDNLVGGLGNDYLLGESGDDSASGGDGIDFLLGGDGNDLLHGDSGEDGLYGENGDDTLFGGAEGDTLFGGAGNDTLNGGDGADALRGETGDDIVDGGAGDDLILGGDGADSLSGFEGADTIYGENGDDDLRGMLGNDILLGGDGNDLLDGSLNDDQLFGEGGDDRLIGGSQNDLLQGGAGADILSGGSGNDILHGGFGNDSYNGGADADTFVFVRSEMNNGDVDSVLSWSAEDDTIQLFGFTPSQVSTAVVGMDVLVLVSLSGGGSATIWFRGVTDNVAVFNDIQFI